VSCIRRDRDGTKDEMRLRMARGTSSKAEDAGGTAETVLRDRNEGVGGAAPSKRGLLISELTLSCCFLSGRGRLRGALIEG
jgi:hypothetical protein